MRIARARSRRLELKCAFCNRGIAAAAPSGIHLVDERQCPEDKIIGVETFRPPCA
mgnify:CR=1 FL=1